MATLTTLRTQVYARLGLDSTAAGNDEARTTEYLNQGVREVLLRTHCYVKCADLTLTTDTWKYDLPTSMLQLREVYSDSSTGSVQLERVSTENLLSLRRAADTTSDPSVMRYAVEGSNLFMVWPTPSSAAVLDVFYVPKPTEMSSGSHDPSNATYGGVPSEFHHAILLYALAQMADQEDDGSSKMGDKYMMEFEQEIRRVKAHVNRKGGRLAPARVKRRFGYVRRDPSVYP